MKTRLKAVLQIVVLLFFSMTLIGAQSTVSDPVRIGVAGLTHGHVGWILGREDRGDVKVVGIYEPDQELARQFSSRFGFDIGLVFNDLEKMLDETRPQAVTAFNPISEHLQVVEACAPRGIHVMVEKPLSFSRAQAIRMAEMARKYRIHLLTNYETSWYATTHEANRILKGEKKMGPIRRMVIRDGHQGPKEIGVGLEFLNWLTDPEKNGGGAIVDFGCYGANLATWLLGGQKPHSVAAVTQQIKPDIYPNVDDEATIILAYPGAVAIIQASWNWPYNRKDMDVYTTSGHIKALDSTMMAIRYAGDDEERIQELPARKGPFDDPFAFLAAVVKGEVDPQNDLSSLEINLVVAEILDAAIRSAKEGRIINLQ